VGRDGRAKASPGHSGAAISARARRRATLAGVYMRGGSTRLAYAALLLAASCAREPEAYERSWPIMGTTLRVRVWAPDSTSALAALQVARDEIALVDNLMSTYQPTSELSVVRRRAGSDSITYVSPATTTVLRAALDYAARTDTALDVTVGPLIDVWGFHRHAGRLPTAFQLDSARALTGLAGIDFDPAERTLRLRKRGMALDFGAIAKGYALDRAMRAMRAAGATAGTVDLGGNVIMFGPAPEGAWQVGIVDPRQRDRLLARLPIDSGAVSTSGDYEQFFQADGVRYSHIFDPRTGLPVQGVASVTVIAPTGMASDALSTAFYVLGPRRGCGLAAREHVDAVWVTIAAAGSGPAFQLVVTPRLDTLLELTDSLPRVRCPS
ncbi:MAG TPA: FAD:protein FMN transferase, partial [Longimicrobiales bacterium]|nr:FAD:protein FMN transferase [Longimicrobiales bacterium]